MSISRALENVIIDMMIAGFDGDNVYFCTENCNQQCTIIGLHIQQLFMNDIATHKIGLRQMQGDKKTQKSKRHNISASCMQHCHCSMTDFSRKVEGHKAIVILLLNRRN